MALWRKWWVSLPEWLRIWLEYYVVPKLGLEPQQLVLSTLQGAWNASLYIFVALGLVIGGRAYMDAEYALSRDIQLSVLKWAPLADFIGKQIDVPREVPLVLWFKESSMQAVNPENCTGIIGAYDLVRSGNHPCFDPGPISDFEVSEQLTIGAIEFKKRCPEVTYWTQNPEVLKKCYLAYNAGISAAKSLDPHESAYVMNGYSEAYTNMIYQDIELGTVTVTSLGAWPTHLAIQGLTTSHIDETSSPIYLTLLDISNRFYDWTTIRTLDYLNLVEHKSAELIFEDNRDLSHQECLDTPHFIGRLTLRPNLNPVTEDPILTQDTHGCEYGLPGIDISSHNRLAILAAPISGELTTYTDQWYNTTIRIENEEWIVWLLHPRSYLVREGKVTQGDSVGVMGAVGYATGPHVHYSVYDKVNDTFIDPRQVLP